MNIKLTNIRRAALVAWLAAGGAGFAQAQEADTNATTIAYWKMNQLATNIPFASGPTIGIPDLATNSGQGLLTGNAAAAAAVDDLYVWGQIQGDFQLVNDAPPGAMFNRGYDGGGKSWNVAHNVGETGFMFYPQDQFGNEFAGPSFTEEIIFKSAGPSAGKQTLIWNHQSSAYAHLQLNEDGNTGDLTFWGYDGSNIQAVRMSNGAGRFDDGQWHCAVCRFDAGTKIMSLYAINQDGSTASNSITLTANLNPEGANNLYIGQDETSTTLFLGEINQVRMSSAALSNAELLCGAGGPESPHIIAYWQMNDASATPAELGGQQAILDLATNAGQGVANGTAASYGVAAAVDNLVVEGPLNGAIAFSNAVPPSSMFNPVSAASTGTASWDAGLVAAGSGDVAFPDDVYGSELSTPSYTEEIFFRADATTGAKQTLIFNHHTSAYCILQINEDGTNGDLTFFSYNGGFPAIRLTSAANGGHRFDDGNWHYAACRFDAGTTNMSLYVLNQDGSYLFQALQLTAPLLPGGAGYTIIGNDETDTLPFNGLINQVRMSDTALDNGELLGTPPPACIAPVVINPPVSTTNYLDDAANFSVNAAGANLQYQWQLDGASLPGATNQALTVFPVQTSSAGNYTVVVSTPCGLATTSAPAAVLTVTPSVAPVVNIARWSMEAQVTTTNTAGVATFQGIFDSDTAPGQGIYSNGGVPASEDDLITFNGLPGGPVTLNTNVAPAAMFINGNDAGTNSYDASAISNVDGGLFFPQDQYGNEFSFQTSFSVELFFKSNGDQSGAGNMELLSQAGDNGFFRYGLIVNEAGPGSVRFAVNNGHTIPTLDLTNANYADGNWHYALGQYDAVSNSIELTVVNTDGSDSVATAALPAGFSPLPPGDDGNMFIGRNTYSHAQDPRTFLGLIDEVQISSGLVTSGTGRLGYIPAVTAPRITGITSSGGIVTLHFTGNPADPASAFSVVGSAVVTGPYGNLPATITSLGGGLFQATLATGGSSEFYRIKR